MGKMTGRRVGTAWMCFNWKIINTPVQVEQRIYTEDSWAVIVHVECSHEEAKKQ